MTSRAVRPAKELIVRLGSQRYVLASETSISVGQASVEGIEPGAPFEISIRHLAGGCNQAIAGDPSRYSYATDGDASIPGRFQRSIEKTTYAVSTSGGWTDALGHRGGFFINDTSYFVPAAPSGELYLITPKYVIHANKAGGPAVVANIGQEVGTKVADYGSFTGSAGYVKSFWYLGREADAISSPTGDGWIGTKAIKFHRTAKTWAEVTSKPERCSHIVTARWGAGPSIAWVGNNPGSDGSNLGQMNVVMFVPAATELDDVLFTTVTRALTNLEYVTWMLSVPRANAAYFTQDGGMAGYVMGGGSWSLQRANVGLDRNFGHGALLYDGGILAPHRYGLMFATSAYREGSWREVGVLGLNPGDGLRTALTALKSPDAPYIVQAAGGEVFMALGNLLFVLYRGAAGTWEPHASRSIVFGDKAAAAIPPSEMPRYEDPVPVWHPIAQLWADDGTTKPLALGVEQDVNGQVIVWVANTNKQVIKVEVRAPLGARYPASKVTGSGSPAVTAATLYGSGYTVPGGVTGQFERADGYFRRIQADDSLEIQAKLDGAAAVSLGTVTSTGPFRLNFPDTSAALGRVMEPIFILTTAGTAGYPSLHFPVTFRGFAAPAGQDVVNMTLLALRPADRRGRASSWRNVAAENVRAELAALAGTVQTLVLPSGTSWTVTVLSARVTQELGHDTAVQVQVRRLA